MSDEYTPLAWIETHKRLKKISVKKIDNTKQLTHFRGIPLCQINNFIDTTVAMLVRKNRKGKKK